MSLDPVTGTPEKHRMASGWGGPELVSLPLTEEEGKGYSLKTSVPTQEGGLSYTCLGPALPSISLLYHSLFFYREREEGRAGAVC